MSDYTQVNDYSAKDALAAGNVEKAISGTDIDAEFSGISTAIASKQDDVGADTASAGQHYATTGSAGTWLSGAFGLVETLDLTNGGADDLIEIDFTTDFADGFIYKVIILSMGASGDWTPEVKLYNETGSARITSSTGYYSSYAVPTNTGAVNDPADHMPLMNYVGFTVMSLSERLTAEFQIFEAMNTSAQTIMMGESHWSRAVIGARCDFSCSMNLFAGNLRATISTGTAETFTNGTAHLYRMRVA